MSWWNKTKYKKNNNHHWFNNDEEEETVSHGRQNWGGYYWQPKYDMSISLETRVTQLIRTITGKNLKLAQAQGWGNDDKYFYYNPEDLKEATDDEVLGRILQQLAKEMYIDRERVTGKNEKEPEYRHLLDSLEANRADNLLAERYRGTVYYASELWAVRKFKDNPLFKYQTPLDKEDYAKTRYGKLIEGFSFTDQVAIEKQYVEYKKQVEEQQNDAWEFCFNIHAFQNGEQGFDFIKDKVADGFTKAMPFIKQYLESPTFSDALKVYPSIQKYYPVPPPHQQEQLDREMGGTQGLGEKEKQDLAGVLDEAEEAKKGQAKEIDAKDAFGFARGPKGDLSHADYNVQRELALYKQAKAQLAPVIGTLHALINSILKDNAVKRYARPFKRGKIDAKRMYKYMATDDLRIFKKARVVNKKDYTMAILLDQSGSMGTELSRNSFHGALVLAEVFEQLGMPYEVLGFRDEVFVYKQFNKGLERALIPSIRRANGGTNDFNAIKVLRNHIRQFDPSQQYRKGVFVITDGEGADPMATKSLVDEIEKLENTTVFGLGIGQVREESLKRTYNHYLKVDDINGLPSTLVNLMRTQFRRG